MNPHVPVSIPPFSLFTCGKTPTFKYHKYQVQMAEHRGILLWQGFFSRVHPSLRDSQAQKAQITIETQSAVSLAIYAPSVWQQLNIRISTSNHQQLDLSHSTQVVRILAT